MNLIAHRGLWNSGKEQNKFHAFARAFENGFGIETDLRSIKGELVLSHDPILNPDQHDRMESLLELASRNAPLPTFINIKEDGLLPMILKFPLDFEKLNIVFFDMSIPELVKYLKVLPPQALATRLSEFETSPVAFELCDWVWVDGFTRQLSFQDLKPLITETNKNWVFVSPELHGRDPKDFWEKLRKQEWLPPDQLFLCTDLAEEFLQVQND